MDEREQAKRCMNLVTAVVLMAITDHQDCVRRLGVELAMLQEPAWWIMSDDERPFGFVWCCGVLDLAPDRLRAVMNTVDLVRLARERLNPEQGKAVARKAA